MKVLVVTPEFPPQALGGGGIVVKVLSKALGKEGHQVTVLTGLYKVSGFFDRPHSNHLGKVKIVWLPLLPTPKVSFQLKTIMPPNPFSTAELLRVFLKRDFDVVHIHGYGHFMGDMAAALSKLARKPYIYTIHGFPKEPQRQGGFLKVIYGMYSFLMGRPLIRGAAKTVVVSNSLARECAFYVSNDKIEVIHNAIDPLPEQKPAETIMQETVKKYQLKGKKIILAIGRLSVAKGFQYAIQALPSVLKKIPQAELVIVGKDDGYGYSQKLKNIALKKEVSSKVIFVGGVNDEVKTALLWQASTVVIPSIEEVFGLVALEAMASGRPIVASRIGGLAEILSNDRYTQLVDSTDIQKLADALIISLSDSRLLSQSIENRISRLKGYDPARMVTAYINLYYSLLCKVPRKTT